MDDEEYLEHAGRPHEGFTPHSGRYKYGSGDDAYQRNIDFIGTVKSLKKDGLTEAQIAQGMGITVNQLRARVSISNDAVKAANISRAMMLKEKGMSATAIGKDMGVNESTVRMWLDPAYQARTSATTSIANVLRDQVEKHGAIDIGEGIENHFGISKDKLRTAVAVLEEEGYTTHLVSVKQAGTGKTTTLKAVAKKDVSYGDIVKDPSKVHLPDNIKMDDKTGHVIQKIMPPISVSSKRLQVVYGDEGGTLKDGVVELRRGVKDLDMGKSRYAQVRIAVDGTHYIKGMAVYSDDLPAGIDMRFNTNKSKKGSKLDALKPMKTDADGKLDKENPFGSAISRQNEYASGGKKKQGALNIVREEGDWDTWSRNLASQFLGKQSTALAKRQLQITQDKAVAELDEIMKLNNPTVKRKLLMAYADSCDSKATHLKAAKMPGQSTKVILPLPHLKETEVYAPTLKNGTKVALVRFPHGGTFEIPEVTVNNKSPKAKKLLGQLTDAIGIHPKTAERLSGADFDGDTVVMIPNNKGTVKSSPALRGLKNFDPKVQYKAYEGMKRMTAHQKGVEMGKVSNLITDMTLHGASADELARAVRHSMVVIDAEKHNLNWRQSEKDNNIRGLREKYQKKADGGAGGASTLLSRTTSDVYIPHRKGRPAKEGGPIDRKTGEKKWVDSGETTKKKVGGQWVEVPKQIKVKRMETVSNAHDLSSGTPMEKLYGNHANNMKALANKARKAYLDTPRLVRNPQAAKEYASEVASLNAKLNAARKNAPLERQAQSIAAARVKQQRSDHPEWDKDDIKKAQRLALRDARLRTGASKSNVVITDREWEAIQKGAISDTKLDAILTSAGTDQIKTLATPRSQRGAISAARKAQISRLSAAGYTVSEIAEATGVSTGSVSELIREGR